MRGGMVDEGARSYSVGIGYGLWSVLKVGNRFLPLGSLSYNEEKFITV